MRIFWCHGFPIISKLSKFVCFYFRLLHVFTPFISKESRRVIHEISVPIWLLLQPYLLWICDISAGCGPEEWLLARFLINQVTFIIDGGVVLAWNCGDTAHARLKEASVPCRWTVFLRSGLWTLREAPLPKRWLKRGKVRLPTPPPCWAINGDIYRERFPETCWAEARKLGSLHWLRYSWFRWDHLE